MNLDYHLIIPDYFMEYLRSRPFGSFKFINMEYKNEKYSIDGACKIDKNTKYIDVNYNFTCKKGIRHLSFIVDLDEKAAIFGNFDEKTIIPFEYLFRKILSDDKCRK